MAAVCGPSVPRHPSPFKRPNPTQKVSTRSAASHSSPTDPYYGHETTAKICTNFVTHLFACPELPPISTTNPSAPSPRLDLFIAYALHRTRLHSSVTFAALYLLRRLKARFPAARGSSGHRLFISAFMLASKVMCDDTYSNKSWSIVGQGMFALREINQMEREMCSYLEWQLNVAPTALHEFEEKVKRDFKGPGPYPSYLMPSPAPSPMPSTTPYAASGSAPPTYLVDGCSPSSASSSKPAPRITPSAESSYVSPPPSPTMPDTPEASHSASTSPASSGSPPTPNGHVDNEVKIASPSSGVPIGVDHHHAAAVAKAARSHSHPQLQQQSRSAKDSSTSSSRRQKHDLFAFAAPVAW